MIRMKIRLWEFQFSRLWKNKATACQIRSHHSFMNISVHVLLPTISDFKCATRNHTDIFGLVLTNAMRMPNLTQLYLVSSLSLTEVDPTKQVDCLT